MPAYRSTSTVPGSLPDNDRAISMRDASLLYGLPVPTLRRYQACGALESYRVGRAVFVSERSLRAFLDSHRIPARSVYAQGGAL